MVAMEGRGDASAAAVVAVKAAMGFARLGFLVGGVWCTLFSYLRPGSEEEEEGKEMVRPAAPAWWTRSVHRVQSPPASISMKTPLARVLGNVDPACHVTSNFVKTLEYFFTLNQHTPGFHQNI
jgi:hypothetical protein